MTKTELAKEVTNRLVNKHPDAETELEWNKDYPYQLVVAVMLSAQMTDEGVNKATKELYKRYKTPKDFAQATYDELVEYTNSINYYKTKTKRILKNSKMLVEDFEGKVPKTVKDLVKLPGIGRKSANVILQELHDIGESIVVDTHVTRVSNRLGLQPYEDQQYAEKIEKELAEIVPEEMYTDFSRLLVLHGRYTCKARKPQCDECLLSDICPSAFSFN